MSHRECEMLGLRYKAVIEIRKTSEIDAETRMKKCEKGSGGATLEAKNGAGGGGETGVKVAENDAETRKKKFEKGSGGATLEAKDGDEEATNLMTDNYSFLL